MLAGFDPIASSSPKVLILGSMPSVKSLDQQEYYAHPQNRFWKVLSAIYQEDVHTYQEKKALLMKHGIALWDVIAYCEREGSLDSKIHQETCNDLEAFLKSYPSIQKIILNGQKAGSLYRRYFRHLLIDSVVLPSTSPANASLHLQDLINLYEKELRQ